MQQNKNNKDFVKKLLSIYEGSYNSFIEGTKDTKKYQWAVLKVIIKNNINTEFGKQHNFKDINSVEEFQKNVPLSGYEDYIKFIEIIARGENNILTSEKVIILEPTSASTNKNKLIPYTKSLRLGFLKGIRPWLYNLYTEIPELGKGVSYWSITPATDRIKTDAKIPIGFESDLGYFEPDEQEVLKNLLLIPLDLSNMEDWESFRFLTLLYMLSEPSLTMISVWNPSFLTVLFEPIIDYKEELLTTIKSGKLPLWLKIKNSLRREIEKSLIPNEKRSRQLRKKFNKSKEKNDLFHILFPKLSLISCWTDAQSQRYSDNLKKYFPKVHIQGKGLLATEGIVSIPIINQKAPVLTILSNFYEFLDNKDSCLLAHQLKKGAIYEVIITTGGGLYRYRLNDLVRVEGFLNSAPLLSFIGKTDNISDIMGEKLHENHVRNIIESSFKKFKIKSKFYLVAPEQYQKGISYTLFLESNTKLSKEKIISLANYIEKSLKDNFHYNYCRKIGQLLQFSIIIIKDGAKKYLQERHKMGQKLGDIKPAVLDSRIGWSKRFNIKLSKIKN